MIATLGGYLGRKTALHRERSGTGPVGIGIQHAQQMVACGKSAQEQLETGCGCLGERFCRAAYEACQTVMMLRQLLDGAGQHDQAAFAHGGFHPAMRRFSTGKGSLPTGQVGRLAAVGVATPQIVTGAAAAGLSANEKPGVGCLGVGGRGSYIGNVARPQREPYAIV